MFEGLECIALLLFFFSVFSSLFSLIQALFFLYFSVLYEIFIGSVIQFITSRL
jgi:hypothetical protein